MLDMITCLSPEVAAKDRLIAAGLDKKLASKIVAEGFGED